MSSNICVCGKSKQFPICDGSHENEGWRCASVSSTNSWFPVVFVSGIAYANLAAKLASQFDTLFVSPSSNVSPHQLTAERVVCICDINSISFVRLALQHLRPRKVVVVGISVPQRALQVVGDNLSAVDLSFHPLQRNETEDDSIFALYHTVRNIVRGKAGAGQSQVCESTTPLPTVFLSHAVKDEMLLQPVVTLLRETFHVRIFMCADSIVTGSDWYRQIISALSEHDIFIYALSKDARSSHFCSFECGMAYAMRKCIKVISLDGSFPPSFLQHVHMVDVPRIMRSKPWLERRDVIVEEFVKAISTDQNGVCASVATWWTTNAQASMNGDQFHGRAIGNKNLYNIAYLLVVLSVIALLYVSVFHT